MASRPAVASGTLPRTGASTKVTPCGRRAATSRTVSGPTVDMSISSWPGLSAAARPSVPKTTCSSACGLATMVIAASTPTAASAGVEATAAPRSARGRLFAAVRFQTVRSLPASSSLVAIGVPISPRPTNASFGIRSLPLSHAFGDRARDGHRVHEDLVDPLEVAPVSPRYGPCRPVSGTTPRSRVSVNPAVTVAGARRAVRSRRLNSGALGPKNYMNGTCGQPMPISYESTTFLEVMMTASHSGDGGRIVVGVDGSESSAHALRWAAEEVRARGSGLEVVQAWEANIGVIPPPSGSDEPFERQANKILSDAVTGLPTDERPANIDSRAVHGKAAAALIDASAGADLLVARGRS